MNGEKNTPVIMKALQDYATTTTGQADLKTLSDHLAEGYPEIAILLKRQTRTGAASAKARKETAGFHHPHANLIAPLAAEFNKPVNVVAGLFDGEMKKTATNGVTNPLFSVPFVAAKTRNILAVAAAHPKRLTPTEMAAKTGKPVKVPLRRGTDSGDGYVYFPDGVRRWGLYGASGVLVRHIDDGGVERFYLAQRSKTLSGGGGTWAFPGGALDKYETPDEGGCREFVEETGFRPTGGMIHNRYVDDIEPGEWAYTTILVTAEHRGDENAVGAGKQSWESEDDGWFTREEIYNMEAELHPALQGNFRELFKMFDTPPVASGDNAEGVLVFPEPAPPTAPKLSWGLDEKGTLGGRNYTNYVDYVNYFDPTVREVAFETPQFNDERSRIPKGIHSYKLSDPNVDPWEL
jgi:8-oxo-dGTP pyrophosphatase MutT (NUDIX family)